MPNDLANRLHINAILVMLSYYMEMEKLDIDCKFDAAKQAYSFCDTHGQSLV